MVDVQKSDDFLTLAEAKAHVALRLGAARPSNEIPAQIVHAMVKGKIKLIVWATTWNLIAVKRADAVEVPEYLQPGHLNWEDSCAHHNWLVSMGGERYWLRPFCLKLSQDDLDAVFQPPEGVKNRPSRGPRAGIRARVEAAMRAEIQSGKITPELLGKAKEKVLAAHYGASRDTVRKACKSVLSVEAGSKPVSKLSKPS